MSYRDKDMAKAAVSTQFIGQGAGSTGEYLRTLGLPSNTGIYTSADTVFVSCNGNRKGRFRPVINGQPQGAYALMMPALIRGARIVMDNTFHRTRTYNSGEREVYDYLISQGAVYVEGIGVEWGWYYLPR